MRQWIFVGLSLATLSGCNKPATEFASDAPDWKDLPRVPHPDFVHWSAYPLGTIVTRQKSIKSASGDIGQTTRIELVEKSHKQVKIRQHVYTTVEEDNAANGNKGRLVSFPATFPLPENMNIKDFELPAVDAKPIGRETVVVAGKDYETTVFRWQEQTEAGPMEVKYWQAINVPGRLVKQESTTIDGDQISEQVVEIVLPIENRSSN